MLNKLYIYTYLMLKKLFIPGKAEKSKEKKNKNPQTFHRLANIRGVIWGK